MPPGAPPNPPTRRPSKPSSKGSAKRTTASGHSCTRSCRARRFGANRLRRMDAVTQAEHCTARRWYPNLFLQPHVVAAVAVLSEYTESPTNFEVHRENVAAEEEELQLELRWRPSVQEKAERLRSTMQRRPVVELAA